MDVRIAGKLSLAIEYYGCDKDGNKRNLFLRVCAYLYAATWWLCSNVCGLFGNSHALDALFRPNVECPESIFKDSFKHTDAVEKSANPDAPAVGMLVA